MKPYHRIPLHWDEALKLVPTNEAGEPQVDLLNVGFDEAYLENPKNPPWVAKPTVAYLWARTARCKACRATVPLLKTRWLAKKDNKRVLLTMRTLDDKRGVVFGIDPDVKAKGGNAAQKREHDKKLGAGTMSRAGVTCPCCGTIMTMEDLRLEGRAGRLGAVMTSMVMDSPKGKEYRLPTPLEVDMAQAAEAELDQVFADVPFGLPTEPTPKGGSGASRAFSVDGYGLDQWRKLFTKRQLLSIGTLLTQLRYARSVIERHAYSNVWAESISAYLALSHDRLISFCCENVRWKVDAEAVVDAFARFAIPVLWDYAEAIPINNSAGSFVLCYDRIATALDSYSSWTAMPEEPNALRNSATAQFLSGFDVVVTDPPYYDAIPYSDLMDFFYVWLRRTLKGLSPEVDEAFTEPLGPKWNHDFNDGELIDDAARFGGNKEASKRNYEAGMARAFAACHTALNPEGRLVIVFAHKQPDAWETLVGAIIKAGFLVDGSWPIQTEQAASAP